MAKAKSKAKAKPKAAKSVAPTALFLLTEPDEMLDGAHVRAGMFENHAPDEIRAYEPDDVVYYMLSTSNGRYLEVDRLWPITTNPTSSLVRDDVWGGWKFTLVELGAPLRLDDPATWRLLLERGLHLKPKRKNQPSALHWPAIKGHVEALRVLIDAGAHPATDDLVMAAACFGKRETAKLLVERGFDGKQAVVTMQRYKNRVALDILCELGFE